jgi:hypothetical protein
MDEQGHCNPSDEPLTDPGDGALSVLPAGPIAAGTTWTFTRRFLVDREMGAGTMSYTDAVARVEDRAGHRVAVINVTGAGRADVAQDLQAKGFRTAAMQLAGVAQFDLTSGLPLLQHYTAHAEWSIRPFGVHIGLIFDDTYDADPFMVKER